MLYPVELRGHDFLQIGCRCAGRNTATLAAKNVSLLRNWGGKRESNPQPPEPQSGALPVELFPPQALIIAIAIQVRQSETELHGLESLGELQLVPS
jgi:hypothetical protein